jgi:hypothetical protein
VEKKYRRFYSDLRHRVCHHPLSKDGDHLKMKKSSDKSSATGIVLRYLHAIDSALVRLLKFAAHIVVTDEGLLGLMGLI